MKPKFEYVITEEVVRFCFEIHLKSKSKDWAVAFTNPTAGPWKKIFAIEGTKKIEIGRYEREEVRPDLILLSKSLRACIIIEAKDGFGKISTDMQMQKNIAVYLKEKKRLQAAPYLRKWVLQGDTLFVNGLLWFSTSRESAEQMKTLYKRYAQQQNNDPLLMVEVIKEGDDLVCYGYIESGEKDIKKATSVLESLYLKSNSDS